MTYLISSILEHAAENRPIWHSSEPELFCLATRTKGSTRIPFHILCLTVNIYHGFRYSVGMTISKSKRPNPTTGTAHANQFMGTTHVVRPVQDGAGNVVITEPALQPDTPTDVKLAVSGHVKEPPQANFIPDGEPARVMASS